MIDPYDEDDVREMERQACMAAIGDLHDREPNSIKKRVYQSAIDALVARSEEQRNKFSADVEAGRIPARPATLGGSFLTGFPPNSDDE